jgi:hypothetical protein
VGDGIRVDVDVHNLRNIHRFSERMVGTCFFIEVEGCRIFVLVILKLGTMEYTY